METLRLNQAGFVTHFLVSGPVLSDVQAMDEKGSNKDQLALESELRSKIITNKDSLSSEKVLLGKLSELGTPWEYYYSHDNYFIDKSTFYPLLKKVEMLAFTCLFVEEECTIDAVLWSFGAFEVFVNGEKQAKNLRPVYKPINRCDFPLYLKSGRNEIIIRFQNLGVRDTRNIIGLQLQNANQVWVLLSEEEKVKPLLEAQEFLDGCILKKGFLQLPKLSMKRTSKDCAESNTSLVSPKVTLRYDNGSPDFFAQSTRYENLDITGETDIKIKESISNFTVSVELEDTKLSRKFELVERILPNYVDQDVNGKEYVIREISKVGAIPRGSVDRFSMYNLLARRARNEVQINEEEEILNDLKHMENRRDCSDFVFAAYMRFYRLYEVSEAIKKRTKEVVLNYRYWMNEEGTDGMCFWSENHSLLFYISAFMAGELYPEDYFVRAKCTGLELREKASVKINDWLDDVLEYGFEEFQSGGYTPITFAGVLNLYDFYEGELKEKSRKVLDKIMIYLAMHTFKGSVISPQGRVYREVLYPCRQSVQNMLFMVNEKTPYFFSEWLSVMATSSYTFSKDLVDLMEKEQDVSYRMGNATIQLYKTEDYIVTSVASEKMSEDQIVWKNVRENEGIDHNSHEYCKSLNECFHGTTRFEPGVYGYQQHMNYIGIDNDTVVFINHPGGTCDATTMRPGYWFGNGIMPAISQKKNQIAMIYQIPKEYPIAFTHVYFPTPKFEEVEIEDSWLFGKKGNSYVGIWTSGTFVPHNDQLFDCEFRVYEEKVAYLLIAGDKKEYKGLPEFIGGCKSLIPSYDKGRSQLKTKEGIQQQYVACENKTQYVR